MTKELEFRKDLDGSVLFDLIQFVKLFDLHSLTRRNRYEYFKDIRSCWITTDMRTIWQLSAEAAKENTDPMTIGWDDMASKSFFLGLVNGLLEANPKFESMRKFLK